MRGNEGEWEGMRGNEREWERRKEYGRERKRMEILCRSAPASQRLIWNVHSCCWRAALVSIGQRIWHPITSSIEPLIWWLRRLPHVATRHPGAFPPFFSNFFSNCVLNERLKRMNSLWQNFRLFKFYWDRFERFLLPLLLAPPGRAPLLITSLSISLKCALSH